MEVRWGENQTMFFKNSVGYVGSGGGRGQNSTVFLKMSVGSVGSGRIQSKNLDLYLFYYVWSYTYMDTSYTLKIV